MVKGNVQQPRPEYSMVRGSYPQGSESESYNQVSSLSQVSDRCEENPEDGGQEKVMGISYGVRQLQQRGGNLSH